MSKSRDKKNKHGNIDLPRPINVIYDDMCHSILLCSPQFSFFTF